MATYDVSTIIGQSFSIYSGDIFNFPYSANSYYISLPVGKYKLECWGAEGGGSRLSGNSYSGLGGKGGYSVGELTTTNSTTKFYICVGGKGQSSTSGEAKGGTNGGGSAWASSDSEPGNGGGGASDVRVAQNDINYRIIVAGGGGGGGEDAGDAYGHGGGTSGVSGSGSPSNGTQTSAGTNGIFGAGATTYRADGGGGGGGWYGGGTSQSETEGSDSQGGGGGSGFVLTKDTYSTTPSGYAFKSSSSYWLENAETIAGNQTFLSPTGATETGHTGDGFIRLTILGAKGSVYVGVNDVARKVKTMYVGVNGVARKVKKIYVGVNGVARLCYEPSVYKGYISVSSSRPAPATPTPPIPLITYTHDGSIFMTESSQYINSSLSIGTNTYSKLSTSSTFTLSGFSGMNFIFFSNANHSTPTNNASFTFNDLKNNNIEVVCTPANVGTTYTSLVLRTPSHPVQLLTALEQAGLLHYATRYFQLTIGAPIFTIKL